MCSVESNHAQMVLVSNPGEGTTWRTTLGLLQVFFLWPPTPQFEHFASFLSLWGMSPLFGHVGLLFPGSRHILQNRVCLLVPQQFSACTLGVCDLFFALRSSVWRFVPASGWSPWFPFAFWSCQTNEISNCATSSITPAYFLWFRNTLNSVPFGLLNSILF